MKVLDLAPSSPKLCISTVTKPEIVLGAFQRAASALHIKRAVDLGYAISRRRSGGPAVVMSPGDLHMAFVLPQAAALMGCEPSRLVNRYIRPLLPALSALGAPATYLGRDWVTVAKIPAAWVGFAHDPVSQACLLEVFISVRSAFSLPPQLDAYPTRTSPWFLGKMPKPLEEIFKRRLDVASIAEKIVVTYQETFKGRIDLATWEDSLLRDYTVDQQPPYSAYLEETIGFLCAAKENDKIVLGGDLFASEGALDRMAEAAQNVVETLGLDSEALTAAMLESLDGCVIDGIARGESFAELIAKLG